MGLRIKRAYERPDQNDGYRVLVDRLWPRGIKKEKAKVDEWVKDVAPSDDLRKWFRHNDDNWDEFKRRYYRELDGRIDDVDLLVKKARCGRLTLLYAARDEQRNNAVALAEYLQKEYYI